MTQSDYYLYIIPQTGKVYRVRDFSRPLERLLCKKYGRIFAISGYSRAAKIVSLAYDDRLYEMDAVHGDYELSLEKDYKLPTGFIGEVSRDYFKEPILTKEDIAEGIRCSLL